MSRCERWATFTWPFTVCWAEAIPATQMAAQAPRRKLSRDSLRELDSIRVGVFIFGLLRVRRNENPRRHLHPTFSWLLAVQRCPFVATKWLERRAQLRREERRFF